MNNIMRCLVLSVCIMIGLPWLAVKFMGSSGMAAVFILFFAVNPAFSVINGISSGKDMKKHWWLPVIPPVFFLLGTWIFFDPGESAFLMYAGIYLLLGLCAMVIAGYVRNRAR